jgi:hypothetical protein
METSVTTVSCNVPALMSTSRHNFAGAEGGKRGLTVAFVHPDMGIGGAERWVVDAACGLKNRGYKPYIYTWHHNPKHCFQETRDGTLTVKVIQDQLYNFLKHRCFVARICR